MPARSSLPLLPPLLGLLLALPMAGIGCVGLDAGTNYPSYSSSDVKPLLLSPENEPNPSISFGSFKIASKACEGLDTHPTTARLTQDDFTRFLETQGEPSAPVKARGNLYWFDFAGDDSDEIVRLRLAVLDNAEEAADDLHRSMLEHGPGWWGIRRSNLAILAPKAGLAEAVAFALKHKLPCWGVMSMAKVDDVYVVPGPYAEL